MTARAMWPRELQAVARDPVADMVCGELEQGVAEAMIRSLARWGLSDHQVAETLELSVDQVRRALSPATA